MIEGRHVKVLGHGCDPSKLGNVGHVTETIQAIVAACGMRVLGLHPYDVEIEIGKLGKVPFEDEGGVTVVGVLSTSHASIHTWPARGFFVLDVYSCRDFSPERVLDVLLPAFDPSPERGEYRSLFGCGLFGSAEDESPSATTVSPVYVDRQHKFQGKMTAKLVDISFALDMPGSWREPAPEFVAKLAAATRFGGG